MELQRFKFDGKQYTAGFDGKAHWIGIPEICRDMRVTVKSQVRKIKARAFGYKLHQGVHLIATLYFNHWLNTFAINKNRFPQGLATIKSLRYGLLDARVNSLHSLLKTRPIPVDITLQEIKGMLGQLSMTLAEVFIAVKKGTKNSVQVDGPSLVIPEIDTSTFNTASQIKDALIAKGFKISRRDDSVRRISAALGIIDDPAYGRWIPQRNGSIVKEYNWVLFHNARAMVDPYMLQFVTKGSYGQSRAGNIESVLQTIKKVGVGRGTYLARSYNDESVLRPLPQQ